MDREQVVEFIEQPSGFRCIVLAPLKVVDQLLPRSDEADTKGDEALSFVKLK